MAHTVIIAHSEYREGLYIDNICVYQSAKIALIDLLLYIKLHLPGDLKLNDIIPDVWQVEEDWIKQVKFFPKHFKDVKVRF